MEDSDGEDSVETLELPLEVSEENHSVFHLVYTNRLLHIHAVTHTLYGSCKSYVMT